MRKDKRVWDSNPVRIAIIIVVLPLLVACTVASSLDTGTATVNVSPGQSDSSPTATTPPDLTNTLIPVLPPVTPVLSGTPLPESNVVISPENAQQVTQLARWGYGRSSIPVISPDGTLLVVRTTIGLHFYDVETLEEIRYIELESQPGGLAFSPDGQELAVGTRERVLFISVADGKISKTLERGAIRLAFSPEEDFLAIANVDTWDSCRGNGTIEIWQVSTLALVQSLAKNLDCITDLEFSRSSRYLAATSYDVMVWEITDDAITLVAQNGGCGIFEGEAEFSPNEVSLFFGYGKDSGSSGICSLRISDNSLNGPIAEVNKYDALCAFPQIRLSPDGRLYISRIEENFEVWDSDQLTPIQTLEGFDRCSGRIVGWLPEKQSIVVWTYEGELLFWDTETGEVDHRTFLEKHGNYPAGDSIVWVPDGKSLAVDGYQGDINFWQTSNGTLLKSFDVDDAIQAFDISSDGQYLAVATGRGSGFIWRIQDGTIVSHSVEDAIIGFDNIEFSKTGKLIAFDTFLFQEGDNSGSDFVQVWDTDTWRMVVNLPVSLGVAEISISPDELTLAIANREDLIELFNIQDSEFQRVFRFYGNIDSLFLSPDGSRLFASNSEGTVIAWHLSDGSVAMLFEPSISYPRRGFDPRVEGLAISPNGSLLAIPTNYGDIILLDASNGEIVQSLTGHTMWVNAVAFSPDGTLLASISLDGTIRIWGIP